MNVALNCIRGLFAIRIGQILIASALAPACTLDAQLMGSMQNRELVRPSEVNRLVQSFDAPNVIVRPADMTSESPLMVFLPGTGGRPMGGLRLLEVMAEQGFRAIGLEYDDEPAIMQVCPRSANENCPAMFREMRVWGTGASPDVINPPAESIAGRLTDLLELLPRDHVLVFNLDLPEGWKTKANMPYHVVNIIDERYTPQWKFMIGEAAHRK